MTMDRISNKIQKISKKVSEQGFKELAIIQFGDAFDHYESAIRSLIQQFANTAKRIDLYWYPSGMTPSQKRTEIEDLEPHYSALWILPDCWIEGGLIDIEP